MENLDAGGEALLSMLQQGTVKHQAGLLDEAESFYRALLRSCHDVGTPLFGMVHAGMAHFHLGILAYQLGVVQDGLQHFRLALENGPSEERYWLGYIAALRLAGHVDAAQEIFKLGSRQVLAETTISILQAWLIQGEAQPLPPSLPARVHAALLPGCAASEVPPVAEVREVLAQIYARGDYPAVETAARGALFHYPEAGFVWQMLGLGLWGQGRPAEALDAMGQAVELMPGDADVLSASGVIIESLGHPEDAETIYRQALIIDPGHCSSLCNLGDNLRMRNFFAEARPLLERALDLRPDYPEAHNNLGCLLRSIGDRAGALKHLEAALNLRPDYPEALINLANLLQDSNAWSAAESALRKALALSPGDAMALNNLSNLLSLLGRAEEAETLMREALRIRPDYHEARSNLLFNLNYGEVGTPEARLQEAVLYGQAVSRQVQAFSSWDTAEHPDKLRIGLVSGDLYQHPVGFFLADVLQHLVESRIELVAYPTQDIEDHLTCVLRGLCHGWRPLARLDDAAAAGLIRQDGIHILIDLSGHTAFNRLPVFAWKPAPVQVSWLGYFATTGVPGIDYILADATGVPEAHRRHFTEEVFYLPETRLCFSEPVFDIPVGPLPCLRKGQVTFGSFQNLAKAGDRVLSVWARILCSLPESSLRWQCKQFDDPAVVAGMRARLEKLGVAGTRIDLHGVMPRHDYLAAHDEVDLILDTFPYPGGTTTCEALWMGVPTLTLAGESMLARQGASLMQAAGLPEWIVRDEEAYVSRALALASDPAGLGALRAGLRERVRKSALFDAQAFAGYLETALWTMWAASRERRAGTVEAACLEGEQVRRKVFLHVGCGSKTQADTLPFFNTGQWDEMRLDINPEVRPDIVASMTCMPAVADASVDAIFSSHNIEHLFLHEVRQALHEFLRVLKPNGMAIITCPDLRSVCARVVSDGPMRAAYDSPAGPITPHDILYGHGESIERGNVFMAHRSGFTKDSLADELIASGFAVVNVNERPEYFDLWAVAGKRPMTEEIFSALEREILG